MRQSLLQGRTWIRCHIFGCRDGCEECGDDVMTARSPNTLTTFLQLIPAEAQKAVEETEEATKEADRAIGEATFQSDLFLLRTMDLYS